ncbi:hypothetical protein FOA52_009623 [Chlamydomonas sp. UWO 241]|nr:hypothetical protein FOA52_009623 [Chlamydomonas sp. UWO 241]
MGVDIKGHFSKNTQAWFVLASSLIVIIASSIECTDTKDCTGVKGWAVGASSVSLGFCFFYLIAAFFMESACETIAPYLATFLLVWWFPGAFILTFNGPFKMVGNGYFGSWAVSV